MKFTLHAAGVAGGLAVAAILSSDALMGQGAPAPTAKPYSVPRTPWGDPDLQGKWPSTDLVGVPMQRDPKLGTRNVLNEEEFKTRQEQFARQAAQDEAEFDLETGRRPRPAATWAVRSRRRRTGSSAASRSTRRRSSSIRPTAACRRSPPRRSSAQQRQQAQQARRKQLERPRGRFVPRSQPLRPLHHARHRRLDPAGHLQQRQRDRAGAGLGGHSQRDDSRDARRAARRAPATRSAHQDVDGRSRAAAGTATRSWSRPRTSIRTSGIGRQRRRRTHQRGAVVTERFTRVAARHARLPR